MINPYKTRLIAAINHRIEAQQPDIDALERNPDNNRMVNALEVATERRKEAVAILEECITREEDTGTDPAVMAALKFYADESNYAPDISEVTGVKPGTGVMEYDISNIESDEGAKARDALKLIENEPDKVYLTEERIKTATSGEKIRICRVLINTLLRNGHKEDWEDEAVLITCLVKLGHVENDLTR